MFTMMLTWEDEETGEKSSDEVFIDDCADWISVKNHDIVYYLWEQDVYSYSISTGGTKRAQSIGIFSNLVRQ